MAKKINIYERDNRKFEVITVNVLSFNGLVAETHVREIVRPNWLIFRTRYIDSTVFFIDDYETILEGEIAMLDAILQKEKEEKERSQKWAEFNK
jgi:hypothetical protein